MKLFVFILVGLLTFSVSKGVEFYDDAFFLLDNMPTELSSAVLLGHDIDVNLEENPKEGYAWVAKFDPRIVKVKIEHKVPKKNSNKANVTGFADIEIKPLTNAPATIVLNYIRPYEENPKPLKSVTCVVTPMEKFANTAVNAPVAQVVPAASVTTAAPVATIDPNAVPASAVMVMDNNRYRINKIPQVLKVVIPVGGDIDFDFEEVPSKALFWTAGRYNTAVCYIKLEHDNDNDWFDRPEAEIEIKGLSRGTTVVDFTCGTGAAATVVRCYIEVI